MPCFHRCIFISNPLTDLWTWHHFSVACNTLHKRSHFCFDLWCPLSCKLANWPCKRCICACFPQSFHYHSYHFHFIIILKGGPRSLSKTTESNLDGEALVLVVQKKIGGPPWLPSTTPWLYEWIEIRYWSLGRCAYLNARAHSISDLKFDAVSEEFLKQEMVKQ